MFVRLYQILVVALWLAAMSWLVAEKILPPLLGGTPPDYDAVLAQQQPKPDYWSIRWNGRPIGFAGSEVVREPSGELELRNVVKFEELPLDALLSQVLGVWSRFMRPMLGSDSDYRVNATLATRVWFDEGHAFRRFQTVVEFEGSPAPFWIRGRMTQAGKLDVEAGFAAAAHGSASAAPLFHQQIDLPQETLVSDSFTPRGELKNLHLGQSWTIPVYRPFPPNSPVQIVAVKVERHEIIFWYGRDVETFLLVYRGDAGSGIRASRQPIAREWVQPDGMVLRQEITMSGLQLQLERLPDDQPDQRRSLLDTNEKPQLWVDVWGKGPAESGAFPGRTTPGT